MKRTQIAAASNQCSVKMNPNAFSKSESASTEKCPFKPQVPLEKSAQRGRLENHLVMGEMNSESYTHAYWLFISFRVFEGRPDLLPAGASLLLF